MILESNLWNWLKKARGMNDLHMTRIENGVESGFPDVDACYSGVNFQIELKVARGANNISLGLRPSQKLWINHRTNVGGAVFVLAWVNGDRWLIPMPCARVYSPFPVGLLPYIAIGPIADPTYVIKEAMGVIVHGK